MVAEWHESFRAGEDAVMVAKQNVEVERLNAMARQLRQEAGQLGEREIEVGEARFAAGDQVITRVNDRAADIYNRERWQVAEVDPDERRVVLEGIDQARTVEVDADYLAKTNPHSDAPALQHAYAVTTYSAQGTTVDRAFVAADPSMDKQEMYVAVSRSRGETTIFATPEVQVDREEFAPGDPYLRRGIPHIAEASERDRAQTAAHDEALRSELRGLPTDELVSRRGELAREAGREDTNQERRRSAESWLEDREQELDHAVRQCEAAEAAPRKVRREALPGAEAWEADARERVERLRDELREMPPVRHEARAELANADLVLSERHRLAITAAQLHPPDYIVAGLGSARAIPGGARHGTAASPRSRGIAKSTGSPTATALWARSRWAASSTRAGKRLRSRLAEQQRGLGLQQDHSASLELDHGMELEIGIG
jgi:hypothetical protein